ncbi:pentachlorophenol monooxygenase [Taibaiella lutea]|uniref:Pentachlorophenol monooxygenase n=1 Tax=Taibaiella lutea TaxID=2608001 RepID=A0A5M6CBD1_9BACT|nr:FAD-dependent monooxygenase [Taibaiella lutea]KAA5532498.1 pentachlorophenol monooxygenase [Taibaiella lutea]
MEHSSIHKTQVVIAGAGPTGLSLAAQLIRHNIDFIILERNEATTHLSKAVVVQARSLEIFEELGIIEEAMKLGRETTGMNLFYKGKRKAAIDLKDLGEGVSRFPFALSLEQSKTEHLLAAYLSQKGKQVQWKSEVIYFDQQADKVLVYYKDSSGRAQEIEADYLVGCDGAGSVVRHQLNLTFSGSTKPKLFYVADVVLSSTVINEDNLYMYMIKKGFVLFFPMEGAGHYRIVGIVPEHQQTKAEYTFEDIKPLITKEIVSPIEFTELRWFSTYKVHSRMADAFMDKRCFVAGDAAHIHTPAGGQGMNTGIQDAYNLAWKIAYTLTGEVNDNVLKTYNTERCGNAKHLLQTTDRMFDVISGVNPFWNTIRLAFFPLFLSVLSKSRFIKQRIFPLLSQTGIAYPESYLTLESAVEKVRAGDRMHYFVFADGKHIFSYLTEPVFKLLFFGKKDIQNPLKDAPIKMTFHAFNEIPATLFGNNTEFYILLRPDNHISYIGKDIDACRKMTEKISN